MKAPFSKRLTGGWNSTRSSWAASRWNDFEQARPDTVSWVVNVILNAADPERAVLDAQADEVHGNADLVVRIPGPAGPIYKVGSGGRRRTHAMGIPGVPLMVAEVTVDPLPLLVEHNTTREQGYPDYMAELLIERALTIHPARYGKQAPDRNLALRLRDWKPSS